MIPIFSHHLWFYCPHLSTRNYEKLSTKEYMFQIQVFNRREIHKLIGEGIVVMVWSDVILYYHNIYLSLKYIIQEVYWILCCCYSRSFFVFPSVLYVATLHLNFSIGIDTGGRSLVHQCLTDYEVKCVRINPIIFHPNYILYVFLQLLSEINEKLIEGFVGNCSVCGIYTYLSFVSKDYDCIVS